MIDPPVVNRALKLVNTARSMGLIAAPAGDEMMQIAKDIELARNAAGRLVPLHVNGREQTPFLGVGKYEPHGLKAGAPIRSSRDYPANGDKRVPDLETALRLCGLRDGMVISSHHHLARWRHHRPRCSTDRRSHGRQRPDVVPERVVSIAIPCDRSDGSWRRAPHRRIDERSAWAITARAERCAAMACCVRMAAAGRRFRMAKYISTLP